MGEVVVNLVYTEEEAREVARTFLYFTSNVSATPEDQDRMSLIRSAIKAAIPALKPNEPQGLGAVVEDERGERWVRVSPANLTYPGEVWQDRCGGERWTRYADIAAVKVLSEGVQ